MSRIPPRIDTSRKCVDSGRNETVSLLKEQLRKAPGVEPRRRSDRHRWDFELSEGHRHAIATKKRSSSHPPKVSANEARSGVFLRA